MDTGHHSPEPDRALLFNSHLFHLINCLLSQNLCDGRHSEGKIRFILFNYWKAFQSYVHTYVHECMYTQGVSKKGDLGFRLNLEVSEASN